MRNNKYIVISNTSINYLDRLNLSSTPDKIVFSDDEESVYLARILSSQYNEASLEKNTLVSKNPKLFIEHMENEHDSLYIFVVCTTETFTEIGSYFSPIAFDEIFEVEGTSLIKGYPEEHVRLLAEKDAVRYYNDIYPSMIYSWQKEGTVDFREKFLGRPVGKKILDLGCANGNLAKSLLPHNTVYGVDISEELVRDAKKNLTDAVVCNLDKDPLPYSDSFFDIVIGFDIFEHVFYPDKTIKEVFRVMKIDAQLKVSIPINHPSRHATMAHFIHKTTKKLNIEDELAAVVPDVSINTYPDTISLFMKNGFEVIHAEGWEWPWKNTASSRAEFLKKTPDKADDVFLTFKKISNQAV